MTELETLYQGQYLRLRRAGRWEFVERANARGAVVIVAVTPADELLLVEQPRPALDAPVLELPAGLVGDIAGEADEALAVAAARELEEETGYRATRLCYMTGGPPSAGLSAEILWFYRAYDLARVSQGGGDHSESITVHAIGLDTVDEWLAARERAGVYVDPKIYTGLYFIRRERR